MGKGRNADIQHFIFYQQFLQKGFLPGSLKYGAIMLRGYLTPFHAILTFNDLKKEAFEKIVGKGENADNQHFLLFPQCFLSFQIQISFFDSHLLKLSPA